MIHEINSPEGVFLLVIIGLFLISGVTGLLFGRLCLGRIEKQIREAGLPRPGQWDGTGFRIFSYAWAVAFTEDKWKSKDDPFVDVRLVRHYAKPFDRYLGLLFIIAGHAFAIAVICGGVWGVY